MSGCLSALTCKVEMIIDPPSQGCCEDQVTVKSANTEQCLASTVRQRQMFLRHPAVLGSETLGALSRSSVLTQSLHSREEGELSLLTGRP